MYKRVKVVNYFVSGYCKCIGCNDFEHEFPDFQFETRSLKFVIDFVRGINDSCIYLEIISIREDGTERQLDVQMLKDLIEEMN